VLILPKFRPRTAPAPGRPPPERESEGRSIEIGLVCTILFHVLILWLAPKFPVEKFTGAVRFMPAQARGTDLNIQLAPGDLPPPPRPQAQPFRFVETNPNAPENTPDRTDNFGAQNQQAAQPDPDKNSKERMPRTQGRDDFKNDSQILSGDMAKPQLGEAAPLSVANSPATSAEQQQARAQEVPLPGFEKKEGDNKEGVGTNISESKLPTTNGTKLVDGTRDATNADGLSFSTNPSTGRPQPRPRPRLTEAPPAILQNRIVGTADAGPIALDARWSEFGQYMNEFVAIVREQWYSILDKSRVSPPTHSFCIIRFKLNSDGETTIQQVPEETCGKQGVWAAQGAIQDRQPYRKWSSDMIAVLGNEQEITFRFYYYW
jgi:hypothetical protein